MAMLNNQMVDFSKIFWRPLTDRVHVTLRGQHGETPLHMAALRGGVEVLQLLLAHPQMVPPGRMLEPCVVKPKDIYPALNEGLHGKIIYKYGGF